jgi:hypothetical protein
MKLWDSAAEFVHPQSVEITKMQSFITIFIYAFLARHLSTGENLPLFIYLFIYLLLSWSNPASSSLFSLYLPGS